MERHRMMRARLWGHAVVRRQPRWRVRETRSRRSVAAPSPASTDHSLNPKPKDGRRAARQLVRALKVASGLVVLVVIGYAVWLGYSLVRFQQQIYKPLPSTPTATAGAGVQAISTMQTTDRAILPTPTPDLLHTLPEGRVNVLVLGTDKRPNDPDHYPRSDTILLVNLDTVSSTVRIMTIPRDLIMDIPGYGRNKVNAAYLFGEYYREPGGGQALAVRTISQYFDVPIDYYVTVNFEGFRRVIDTLGGVLIYVPYEMDDYNYPSDDEGDPFGIIHVHFDKGWQYMDGKQALRYARTRHADNDFARSRRQLQIILAARERAMSLDLVPKLPMLIDQLGGMVETNIPLEQQIAFVQLGYRIESSNIYTYTIDSSMIIPTALPDGSEGLRLNWQRARPMLEEFFGVQASTAFAGDAATTRRATPTTQATPRTRPARTPTPVVKPPAGTKAKATPTRTRTK